MEEQAPTNLTVRQVGINRVRVSWILPSNSSGVEYQISTSSNSSSSNFSDGRPVAPGLSFLDITQQPSRVYYWLVSTDTSPPEIVVGPVIGIVRGEEISHNFNHISNHILLEQISLH